MSMSQIKLICLPNLLPYLVPVSLIIFLLIQTGEVADSEVAGCPEACQPRMLSAYLLDDSVSLCPVRDIPSSHFQSAVNTTLTTLLLFLKIPVVLIRNLLNVLPFQIF